ncbi:MAG TPA: hypothetical protein VET26_02850, partial [Candidatus Sulfotelmatobacter sp.]|nr:hypothetical protein [Candidatus Sulfotelmatobacter sp.]
AGMTPKATAMVLVSARFNPTPDRVYDDQGNLIYSESRSVCEIRPIPMALPAFLCHASPAWVIHLRNAQGWDGYVVVDSGSGRVGSASVSGPG